MDIFFTAPFQTTFKLELDTQENSFKKIIPNILDGTGRTGQFLPIQAVLGAFCSRFLFSLSAQLCSMLGY